MTTELELSALVDIAAEQCVLGAMILSVDVADEIINLISRSDFSDVKHQELFDILKSRRLRSEQIDSVAIGTVLAETPGPFKFKSLLAWFGGASYIHQLISSVPTAANAAYYARAISHKALRRRVITVGQRIAHMGTEADDSLNSDVLINRVVREAETLYPTNGFKTRHNTDIVSQLMIDLKSDKPLGLNLSTGYRDLDRLLGPLDEGRVIVVAGRPGQGKSVFAGDVARFVAGALNAWTLYVTLEMNAREVTMRNLAALAKVDYTHLRDHTLTANEYENLEIAGAKLERLPLTFWDKPHTSIDEIDSHIRVLEKSGKAPALVVIDYLQLLAENPKLSSRQDQVAELSRKTKLLAQSRRCVVLLLAQLNRGPEQRVDKRPLLSDLRESGAVEQDADQVVMLHRPEYYDKADHPGEGEFIVVKNRHGATGMATVAAQLQYMRFVDMALTR